MECDEENGEPKREYIGTSAVPCKQTPHTELLLELESRLVTMRDLINLLWIQMDQATALFVEKPSVRSLFDQPAPEGVSVGLSYYH
jgi:hypothetical protein